MLTTSLVTSSAIACSRRYPSGSKRGYVRWIRSLPGGDEFAVLLESLDSEDDCGHFAQDVLDAVAKPLMLDQHEIQLGASLGVAFYPEDAQDQATLLKHAEIAMYAAKDDGRGAFRYFRQNMIMVLATAAAVIASQALITGAYSVTKQVIQLGYLPRLRVEHTNVKEAGQIYMPFVNWNLFVAIVLAVVMFRSSSNLAAAYGIAVTLDMLITTTLTFFVVRYNWRYPLPLCIAATGCFFLVDLAFFSSNLLKLLQGGWFPLFIGSGVFLLMMTWQRGRELLHDKRRAEAIDLRATSSPP